MTRRPSLDQKCHICGEESAVYTCRECVTKMVASSPPEERRGRASFHRVNFPGTCAKHGETLHSWRHGGCLTCFTDAGAPRRRDWRAEARAAGTRHGVRYCEAHGRETPHSLKHGLCLLCFTSKGARRHPRRPVTWFAHPGDELAQRRRALGWSVELFAASIGAEAAQLIAWEMGADPPTPAALDLARAFSPRLEHITL